MQYDDNAEKYGYEGEMTPMKCDELKAHDLVDIQDYRGEVYLKKDVDSAIAELKDENATLQGANDEKAERIVELQKQVDELVIVKKSAELIFMNLLDCGLIKEWYFNGKFNAVLKDDTPLLKIEALKQKLEDVQASAYAESVDAGMRERRLKRGLWHAREWRAWCEEQFWLVINDNKPRDIYHLLLTNRIHRTPSEWIDYWYKVEQLCGKKAEEYK